MKYIHSTALEELCGKFEELRDTSRRFVPKLDLFSLKMIRSDKKLYGSLSESPSYTSENITPKNLTHIISALNLAYADYDFTSIRLCQLHRIDLPHHAMASIQGLLLENLGDLFTDLGFAFLSLLEDIISPFDCEVFIYNPDAAIDPDPLVESGSVSSNYYFFLNKHSKKLLLISFALFPSRMDDDEDMFDMM
ncbi:hypothetical protein RCL1_009003 [Eukaryota sp. TZLM3-RCL]